MRPPTARVLCMLARSHYSLTTMHHTTSPAPAHLQALTEEHATVHGHCQICHSTCSSAPHPPLLPGRCGSESRLASLPRQGMRMWEGPLAPVGPCYLCLPWHHSVSQPVCVFAACSCGRARHCLSQTKTAAIHSLLNGDQRTLTPPSSGTKTGFASRDARSVPCALAISDTPRCAMLRAAATS
jgi:hypothetical protein